MSSSGHLSLFYAPRARKHAPLVSLMRSQFVPWRIFTNKISSGLSLLLGGIDGAKRSSPSN